MNDIRRDRPPAVILAAGNGYRLVTRDMDIPKPLCTIGNTTLLDHVLETFTSCGFSRFVIVTGYLAEKIERHIRSSPYQVDIELAHNPDFEQDNGLSVLASNKYVDGDFVLAMADHLLEPQMVNRLVEARREPTEIALAVDHNPDRVFDLDEATKAQVADGRVRRVGKALTDFEAVDTGLFYAGRPLIDALERCVVNGQTKLSDSVNLLAEEDRVRAVDIGVARWVDVDTPQAMAEAEQWLGATQPAAGR